MELIIALVSALASARVWRALMLDDIGFWFRDRAWVNRPKVWDFLNCPWCFGFHLCVLFVATGVALGGPIWWIVAGSFAANYISANLNVHLGDKQ